MCVVQPVGHLPGSSSYFPPLHRLFPPLMCTLLNDCLPEADLQSFRLNNPSPLEVFPTWALFFFFFNFLRESPCSEFPPRLPTKLHTMSPNCRANYHHTVDLIPCWMMFCQQFKLPDYLSCPWLKIPSALFALTECTGVGLRRGVGVGVVVDGGGAASERWILMAVIKATLLEFVLIACPLERQLRAGSCFSGDNLA